MSNYRIEAGLNEIAKSLATLSAAAMIAARAYAKKVEQETQPEMKVNVQGPAPDISWPDGVGYRG